MKWSKARASIYSDSVLCLGGLKDPDDANKRWEEQVSTLKMCSTFSELQGLDGGPIDFEWKIFPRSCALQLLLTIHKDLERKHITLKSVIESFSCPCSITLNWRRQEIKILELWLQEQWEIILQGSKMDTGHYWEQVKKASGTMIMQPVVKANGFFVLLEWWTISRIRDIQLFKRISPLGRGIRKKKKGKDTIRFNGEYSNIDLLCRTVHSANQLRVHGTLTKWCETQSGTESGKRSNPGIRKCSEDAERKRNEARRTPQATTCFWKPNAPESEKFRINASEGSNWISSNDGRILPSRGNWKNIYYHTSQGRRMVKVHIVV